MEPRARRGDPTKSREENREQARRAEGQGERENREYPLEELHLFPLEELHLFPLEELHLFPLKELHLLETKPAQSKGFEGWEKANRP